MNSTNMNFDKPVTDKE